MSSRMSPMAAALEGPVALAAPAANAGRLRALVAAHAGFVWRSIRRLGVPELDADDAAQQVFLVAAKKLDVIAQGSERAFLFSTALRVASKSRRTRERRREVDDEALEARRDSTPGPEELLDRRRARQLLDELLDAMAIEERVVFVLYEIEQLTTPEIAAMLAIPQGTVASRLRRAREDFDSRVCRLEARAKFRGGSR